VFGVDCVVWKKKKKMIVKKKEKLFQKNRNPLEKEKGSLVDTFLRVFFLFWLVWVRFATSSSLKTKKKSEIEKVGTFSATF
jgi:hypothetical protein